MNCPRCRRENLKECACLPRKSRSRNVRPDKINNAGKNCGPVQDVQDLIRKPVGYRLAKGFALLEGRSHEL